MKRLLTILFSLISLISLGQGVTTPAILADTAKLKAYTGTASIVLVTDSAFQGFYYRCVGCTVDHEKIFQGVAARKWQRMVMPDVYGLVGGGPHTHPIAEVDDLQDELDVKEDSLTAHRAGIDSKQPWDTDLNAIAGLSASNDDVVQRKAGAWTNRTPAQLKTDLALVKADVGLGSVDNTADASKPISTLTQAALDNKQDVLVSATNIKTINNISILGGGNISVVAPTRIMLGADVINDNAVALTWEDVDGLTFEAEANKTYDIEVLILYDAAATSTGSKWALTGPAITRVGYISEAAQTVTTFFRNNNNGHDQGSTSNESPRTTSNVATIRGVFRWSAAGPVKVRFASEVAGSAITAKGGYSWLKYEKID